MWKRGKGGDQQYLLDSETLNQDRQHKLSSKYIGKLMNSVVDMLGVRYL